MYNNTYESWRFFYMRISKIETNQKENKFLYAYEDMDCHYKLNQEESELIILYPAITYQKVLGFGGAFTESSCYLISQLKPPVQEQLLQDYFSQEGLHYRFGRTHINSCDFSLDSYTYLGQENDLSQFDMKREEQYVIPTIQAAKAIQPDLQLLDTPWSIPAFMKDNISLYNGCKLLKTYKQLWADYIVQYIKHFQSHQLPIQYVSIQNEPNAAQPWESCQYTPKEEASFIENYLLPNFKFYNIPSKILVWDHNKERIVYRINAMYKNKTIGDLIDGVAYHYYSGDHFNNLKILKDLCPELLLIHTEGCTGYAKPNKKNDVTQAEIYAHDIIGDFNHGTNAYIDWNLVLDSEGGPNHMHNYCNAPIMLNKSGKKYSKRMPYYYIGHFSKYIQYQAHNIAYSSYTDKIEVSAFKNPDHSIVVILLNRNDIDLNFKINIKEYLYVDQIPKHSIITLLIHMD